jgi:hypothetical protein
MVPATQIKSIYLYEKQHVTSFLADFSRLSANPQKRINPGCLALPHRYWWMLALIRDERQKGSSRIRVNNSLLAA